MASAGRKVKVAHLVTRLDLGGAQQNTLYTVGHLDRARFDVLLACGEGGLLDDETRRGAADARRPFRLAFLPALARPAAPARDAAALWGILRWLRAERPDVLHTHSSKAGVLGRLAAWRAGVPVVVHTYHGFGFDDRQPWPRRRLYAAVERLCCRLSSETVFVSEDNRRYAERYGLVAPGRGRLIRSGIRLADFPARLADRAGTKAALGFPPDAPFVVSVGNLKPQKNPLGFLRVAERVLRRIPGSRWLFAGDGELRAAVEAELRARGLVGKVLFPGWRRDTAELLAAADAFVLSSLWEGLPRALVEAMKTGLPCACYAVDGVKDVLRDGVNGALAEPGDEAALAAKLAALLQDPARARSLGEQAARSIGPEFDIDGMVRAQEALYEELLARRRLGWGVATPRH